ncbi:MAG TPA: glycosyltransferase family 1 protein [Anaerolineae bacterium]|nr:glycosyltransferase family 1 protein [Anaerolineae bacterium]
MRLGINGFFWSRETTGSGQYTRQLVTGLLKRSDVPRCLLIRPLPDRSDPYTAAHSRKIEERFLGPPVSLGGDLSKVWFEQVSFPRVCLSEDLEVAHVPYFAPPLFVSDRTVVTIHDLIPLIEPAYRGSALVRLYTHLVAAGARRAAAIVTDSQASQKDVLRLLGVSPEVVHVIYLAVGSTYQPVTDERELDRVRAKHGLPETYILYLGGFDRRKNLATLLAAYASLDGQSMAGAPLVIAGRLPAGNSQFFPDPRAMVENGGLEGRVIFIGWVTEEDKPALYSGATLFLFPSLYEGFGLPVLEAMSCGTAVVASNAASLPEIAGDAAVLVDPQEPEALATAIADLLKDVSRRKELARRGRERAQLFSWNNTVAQTVAVYESVAAQHRPRTRNT